MDIWEKLYLNDPPKWCIVQLTKMRIIRLTNEIG
mgnify:CR=1 FL=1